VVVTGTIPYPSLWTDRPAGWTATALLPSGRRGGRRLARRGRGLSLFAAIILLLETSTIRHLAEVAASGADPRELPGTLAHSVGGLVVLLVTTILSVVKPRGLTRYGWRKQQQQRRRQLSQPTPSPGPEAAVT